jgi:hypothetical protein
MRIKFLLVSIFILCSASTSILWGQSKTPHDLTGVWEGYQTQNDGGPFKKYTYKLVLKQKGNKVKGQSFCSIEGKPNKFCKITTTGTIEGDYIYFEEADFLTDPNDKEMNMEWCRCKGIMKIGYDGGKMYIMGAFRGFTNQGNECIPGTVYLEKSVPRA